MPKLGKYSPLLRSVFFLYPTMEDAVKGTSSGGTGFLVAVPSKRWGDQVRHIHGITNHHVAVYNDRSSPAPVIRINRNDGTPEVINLDPSDWIFQPASYDVAISPPLTIKDAGIAYLDAGSFFITEQEEKEQEIGPADDVFMIGRFVDYQGVETNSPAVRFGHVSIIDAKIKQHTGYMGRSIVIDMHSRGGFSGSPVFIYRTLGSHFIENAKPGQFLSGGGHYLKLLGIHWGQFPEAWEIKEKPPPLISAQRQSELITEGYYVEGLSGMTCVIPSGNIAEILNLPELVAMREESEQQILNSSSNQLKNAPTLEASTDNGISSDDILRKTLNTTPTPLTKPRAKS